MNNKQVHIHELINIHIHKHMHIHACTYPILSFYRSLQSNTMRRVDLDGLKLNTKTLVREALRII